MQMLFDLLPVVFFFIAYKMAGIYVATAVLIVGVLVQAGRPGERAAAPAAAQVGREDVEVRRRCRDRVPRPVRGRHAVHGEHDGGAVDAR